METRPEAKSCIPFCPGLQAEFGTYKKYYEFVKKRENQDKRKQFLSGRKEWVRQHDENPDKTQLSTARTLGGKFVAPKMQFITKAGWDSSKHGEWDPAKVVKTMMFGEEKEGIWRKIGADGVFDFEVYDDRAFTESQVQHDGSEGPFAELALQRKRKARTEAFQAASKARNATAVQGTEMSLFDLVAQIGSGAQSSGSAAKEPASGQGSAVAVDSSESGEADGSESGDSGDEDMTGMSFWGTTAKAKEPKAKPKPVAKVAAAPKAQATAKPSGEPKGPRSVPGPSLRPAQRVRKRSPGGQRRSVKAVKASKPRRCPSPSRSPLQGCSSGRKFSLAV